MQLLPDEEILVSSNEDTVILTNQRIYLSDKEWGRSYQITIFLENIASIEILYKSNPLLLVLSGICFLVGLFAGSPGYQNDATLRSGSFTLAIIFSIIWFYSRNRVVTIASNGGGKLNFRVGGMKAEAVEAFIDKLIKAKAGRAEYFVNA